jgi:hypothetical protein
MLKEGDIIEIKPGHKIYADVPEHFAFENCKGVFDKIVNKDITVKGELEYFAGKYIVYKTTIDGTEGFVYGPLDSYSNGHHVFCESTEDPCRRIHFYQSGSFTAVITDIQPIGRAELKWKEIKE